MKKEMKKEMEHNWPFPPTIGPGPWIPKQIKEHNWPFPPTTGPGPWTPKQIKEYNQHQRQQLPDAPF